MYFSFPLPQVFGRPPSCRLATYEVDSSSRQEVKAYLGIRDDERSIRPVNDTPPFLAFGGRSSTPRGQDVEVPSSRGRPQRLVPDDFRPGQEIAIDESLWKFRGRLAFRTYNSTKRARFGLKVYKLCASTGPAAGYTFCFKVYTGKEHGDIPSFTKAVLHLMEYGGFLDKGYQLFVDNWYTSPTLFHLLQSRRTNAVETARLNRKFMRKDITVRRRGNVDYRSSTTGLLALMRKDSNNVTMLSTVHTAIMEGEKPLVVKDYNVGMEGVDSRVWYRKVFFLFDVAIVNAWAVHRALGGRDSLKAFRLELIPELLGQFREGVNPIRTRTATRPPVAARRALQQRQHAISEIPDGKRRRCHWCTRQGRRSSRSYCRECDVGLCTYGCFEAWHIL
ncbi:PiggyBac transposable element-derived protein 4 [Penaeus vannamei]|uniref:PiggyBac transposable element-derived protein 4 n=1 Tax=Penaeus vannamei TaxID=6689 RepID=A0A423TV94_PENVA|nr:PiggyBac transposable element-derived protein 4 [Penaeus vannamei]